MGGVDAIGRMIALDLLDVEPVTAEVAESARELGFGQQFEDDPEGIYEAVANHLAAAYALYAYA